VLWLLLAAVILGALALVAAVSALAFYVWLKKRFVFRIVRCFQEKPLFIVPAGRPVPGAEDLSFPTSGGLTLRGCYLRCAGPRRGIVLFGLEFGSNRWACSSYCEPLLANGFDVFTFEPRGQGESDPQAGYEPLQWVTDYEVADFRSALAYLKSRPDADARGVGFFGISKGAAAGLLAAADDPYVRCFVTDGVYATYTTMVPYMRQYIRVYSNRYWLQTSVPTWVYGLVGRAGLKRIEEETGCRFPHLERRIRHIAPRPLLMIHGGADTYIKPAMARALFDRAKEPKEFWLVEGAKHNQALSVAGDEYARRVLEFFDTHLAEPGENEGKGRKEKGKKEPETSVLSFFISFFLFPISLCLAICSRAG
jgi:pimeloyl-ACP methyl ester carboxylesterase